MEKRIPLTINLEAASRWQNEYPGRTLDGWKNNAYLGWIFDVDSSYPLFVVNDCRFITEIPDNTVKAIGRSEGATNAPLYIKIGTEWVQMFIDGLRVATPDEIVRWRLMDK